MCVCVGGGGGHFTLRGDSLPQCGMSGGTSAKCPGGHSARGDNTPSHTGVTGKSVARKLCRGNSFSSGNYAAHN